jgi:hypothetical protein
LIFELVEVGALAATVVTAPAAEDLLAAVGTPHPARIQTSSAIAVTRPGESGRKRDRKALVASNRIRSTPPSFVWLMSRSEEMTPEDAEMFPTASVGRCEVQKLGKSGGIKVAL